LVFSRFFTALSTSSANLNFLYRRAISIRLARRQVLPAVFFALMSLGCRKLMLAGSLMPEMDKAINILATLLFSDQSR
jgi:uncharacterized protein YqfA (UPF0365 family)